MDFQTTWTSPAEGRTQQIAREHDVGPNLFGLTQILNKFGLPDGSDEVRNSATHNLENAALGEAYFFFFGFRYLVSP